ncbi:long-chain-fatty-acid--AMP ligase FadD32 [Nocardia sp. NPDC088792]|uniref:long-chain-fatty-acid--AMP ligase FadD32 n=1 Tax=Nocardia sp. NPDC088792 TaxID=3364332 RepID=UPI0037F6F7F9
MTAISFDSSVDIEINSGTTLIDLIDRRVALHGNDVVYRYADYSRHRDGEYHDLTWSAFDARVRAIAARIQQVSAPGERVAVLCPHGLDYVAAFFAAITAGTIAVPLFTPDEPGHTDRLHAVLGDCAPAVILTTTSAAAGVRAFFGHLPATRRPRMIAVDAVPDVLGARWRHPGTGADSIAYLQYTSGSTRIPAGVEITHRAVCTNLLQLCDALGLDEGSRGVTWLPLFHDMGLLCVILPMLGGRYLTMMSPSAFVRRPYRWIKELGATAEPGGVFSAAPNFAFDYAAARGRPAPGVELDLSQVIGLINGSEPVTVSALHKFTKAFAPYGLPDNAIKPCYGMAEATVFVSATRAREAAEILHVDRIQLGDGRLVRVPVESESTVALVSCGYVAREQWAAIVDSETGKERPDGTVGEIWLHGDNMGVGYWNRTEESAHTFGNTLSGKLSRGSHAGDVPADGMWLRTGDYGAYLGGRLYVTGRLKDLVIVGGRNHYPQDLEYSAQDATTALRPGFVAAFSVPANQLPRHAFPERNPTAYDPDDATSQLVIVAERGIGVGKLDADLVTSRVRAALSHRHGITVRDLLLVPAGSIPRTSSGKIARRACRAEYLDGTLSRTARHP